MVYPSTGLLAIFVALNHCHEVHIAGFGYPSNQSQNHPIHYYGYNTVKDMRVGKVSLSFSSFLSSTCICTVCLPLGFRIAPITFSVKMKPWDTWRSWAPSSGFIHTDVCANSCIEKVKSKKKKTKITSCVIGVMFEGTLFPCVRGWIYLIHISTECFFYIVPYSFK